MQSRQGASGSWAAAHDIESMLEVRASDVLPSWLSDRLGVRFPFARRRILRVFPGKAARVKSSGVEAFAVLDPSLHQPPVPTGVDKPLVEFIRSRAALTVVSMPGKGSRLLVALEAFNEVRYLVELSGDIAFTGAEAALSDFVTIVARYYERLVDAETDPLTRLSNRRVFHSHVDAGLRRWTASGRPHYFAVLDIDYFKRINDGFGHLYGDEILVLFANLMRQTFRAGDLMYRFGGEEFVLIYGVETGKGGDATLERFRSAVESHQFPSVGQVTVSAGYTRISDAGTPAAILIDRADQAVYFAKALGRNRVCSWEDLVQSGEISAKRAANKDATLF
ncbi:MAG: GGDEF domain-containing protein [Usitatibacter sp.]